MQKSPKKIKDFTVTRLDENGKEISKTYQIVEPTAKQVRDARWHYSVVFSQALKDGLMTERQMTDLFNRERMDEKTSTELATLYLRAKVVESELQSKIDGEEESDSMELANLAAELRDIRAEIFETESSVRAPFYNTAEQRAEEARVDYLLQYIVRHGNDPSKLVWGSKEDYESELDYDLVESARSHLLFWMHNLDENWEQNLPENVVFKRLREKILAEEESASREKDSTQKEKPEDEVVEEKKTARKKSAKKSKSKPKAPKKDNEV